MRLNEKKLAQVSVFKRKFVSYILLRNKYIYVAACKLNEILHWCATFRLLSYAYCEIKYISSDDVAADALLGRFLP